MDNEDHAKTRLIETFVLRDGRIGFGHDTHANAMNISSGRGQTIADKRDFLAPYTEKRGNDLYLPGMAAAKTDRAALEILAQFNHRMDHIAHPEAARQRDAEIAKENKLRLARGEKLGAPPHDWKWPRGEQPSPDLPARDRTKDDKLKAALEALAKHKSRNSGHDKDPGRER